MQEIKLLNQSDISIGVLSYKRTDLLLETLSELANLEYKVDLIVVNNNEDFCILDQIKQEICNFKNVNLLYIHDWINYGVSNGRRKIIEHCKTDYIVLLDDDVAVPDINSCITSVLDEFSKFTDVKGIAFNIKEFSTKKHNRFEIPHKNKKIDLTVAFDTYLMIGAGHALDVKAVLEVGNYPDDFGLYGFEEVDLSFRLINAGYRIRYNPNCIVEHKKSPDGRFSSLQVNELAFVNRCKMARRYFKTQYFITCYLVRSVFFLLKTRRFKAFYKCSCEIFKDKKKSKFGRSFYAYIAHVKGFLYW